MIVTPDRRRSIRDKKAAADGAATYDAVRKPAKLIETLKCIERRLMAVPSGRQKTQEPRLPTVRDEPPSLREMAQVPACPLA